MKQTSYSMGNQRVHYKTTGDPDRPALVCLHGLTGSSESYLELADRLESDFYLFMFDQPGHGQTSPLPQDYLFSTLADYYKHIFDHVIGKSFYLLGHSWGGDTALHFASRYPEDVKGLILMDGGFTFPHYQEDMTFQKAYEGWKEFIERFSFENKEDIFEVYKTYTTRWNSYLENMTLAAFTKESPYRLRAGKSVVLPIIEAFFKEPFYQAYEGIQSPVMLIHASDPAELEGAREKGIHTLKQKVANIEIHRKIGGHNLHWDDPDGIADMVKDFTERIKA
jgi:pimeloyl-ACP methyl ester carboxylesterase